MGCQCSRPADASSPPAQRGAKESPAHATTTSATTAGSQAADPGKPSVMLPEGGSTMAEMTTGAGPSTASPDASPTTPALDLAGVRAPSAPALQQVAMSSPAAAPQRRVRPARTVPSDLFTAVSHTGFKAKPELPAIAVKEENIAAHTMPAEALVYTPLEDNVVTKFKNGDAERKIHCNLKLSEPEIEQLQAMRSEFKVQGMAVYPSVATMATRFLSRARLDPKKALKLMQETQHWRQDFFKKGPVTDESIMEDMKHGIVYFSGRDFALRPVIVIRAIRIPQQWYKDRCIDRFIRMLIFCMEYFMRYMVVPGKVENLSVLVDLAGLGISQVPLGPLGEVYKVMSHHYIGRVFKFYVVNMSGGLSMIAGMAKGFLTDRQKQKLNMLDSVEELRREFALHQLEEDLGGSRPATTQFFPFVFQPGPYEAGYSGPIDADAVPNAHEVLTHLGAMGRLWDPRQSPHDNKRLEYETHALGILEKCKLPIPDELRYEGSAAALDGGDFCMGPQESAPQEGQDHPTAEAFVGAYTHVMVEECDEKVYPTHDPNGKHSTEIQNASMCGSGIFCCSG